MYGLLRSDVFVDVQFKLNLNVWGGDMNISKQSTGRAGKKRSYTKTEQEAILALLNLKNGSAVRLYPVEIPKGPVCPERMRLVTPKTPNKKNRLTGKTTLGSWLWDQVPEKSQSELGSGKSCMHGV